MELLVYNQYISSLDNNVTVLPIMPIQLTNTTVTYLDHLNEYCLLEIFSCKSLTLMDLCSIAETCTRFKQITQRVCPKEFAIKWWLPPKKWRNLPQKYEFKSKNYQHLYTLQEIERIVKNFGAHLSELKIHDQLDVVRWVAEHCGNSTLKCLKFEIDGVCIHMNWIFHWLPSLGRLTLKDCELLKDVSSPDLNFDSLIELKIDSSSGCVTLLKHTFPNLERFTWSRSYMYTSDSNNNCDVLYKFIRRHGNLKGIAVSDYSVSSIGLFHVIDSSCKELVELSIGYLMSSKLWFDFTTLGIVAKLKTLDLNLGFEKYCPYMQLLQALQSVQTIKIWCISNAVVSRQIFDILSKLRNLRELYLSSCVLNWIPWEILTQLRKVCLPYFVDRDNLLNIIRHLINLEEIECQFDWSESEIVYYLSEEYFLEIVKIVEQRKHVLTIKSRCNFVFDKNCDKNRKVKLIKLNQ
ncbi:uncharacterized protein LOC119079930 [Bradysia coprophila]|uniref:uncharacterized protein LOC119079930 n=1 Tax=Bradysia coprophila TaxID=38358 RepID=UPI00187DC523|nr:uncharacterized protein LOC119079930 [Bradysia coprophila]